MQRKIVIGQKGSSISFNRGGYMEDKEYAATYHFGNSTVHVVAPPKKSREEIDRILADYHKAGWAIINELIEKGEEV